MFVAMEIERRCDKRTILELYLNRIFFGSGFYGAESASRGYFGKRAKDLTLSEAAMLAGCSRVQATSRRGVIDRLVWSGAIMCCSGRWN